MDHWNVLLPGPYTTLARNVGNSPQQRWRRGCEASPVIGQLPSYLVKPDSQRVAIGDHKYPRHSYLGLQITLVWLFGSYKLSIVEPAVNRLTQVFD